MYELKTLKTIWRISLAQFFGACLEAGKMFMVCEMMEGGDLHAALGHEQEIYQDRMHERPFSWYNR